MAILRGQRATPGTYIPRATAHDDSLSMEALGLLAWLLAHGDGWEVRLWAVVAELRRRPGTRRGRDSARRIIRELETAGYVSRQRRRSTDGRWEWLSIISDSPMVQPEAAATVDGSAGDGAAGDDPPVDKHTNKSRTHERKDGRSSSSAAATDDGDDYLRFINRLASAMCPSAQIERPRGYITTAARDAGLPTDRAAIDRYEAAVRRRQGEIEAEAVRDKKAEADAQLARRRRSQRREAAQLAASERQRIKDTADYGSK